jgi:phage gp36-like protein
MADTYSEVSDLLLGEIPTPSDAGKWVQDATDEIDSKLGFRYVTPIVVDETVAANRVTILLLKRIANWLASGRLVCAKAAASSQQEVNAYGLSLLAQATEALNQLMSGDLILPGAQFVDTGDVGQSGPVINNLDATSLVESFYGFVTPSVFPVMADPYLDRGSIWPGRSG